MRTIALEPHFASKRSTRAFVAGGLAGNLILYEKGWLGHRETVISSGEGPIWQVRWVDGKTTGSGGFIAWANDLGVKIYHPESRSILTYIDRPPNSPRAELFKPTLHWQDESTLLVAWADYLKVARIRARPATSGGANGTSNGVAANLAPYTVEVTAVFQMDACVVAGIVPHPMPAELTVPDEEEPFDVKSTHSTAPSARTDATAATAESTSSTQARLHPPHPHLHRRKSVQIPNAPPLTTFLLLTYIPPPSLLTASSETEEAPEVQKRRASERPELRIVSRTTGEELANDVLGVRDFEKWGCNEYSLAVVPGEVEGDDKEKERCYVVMSPRDLVVVRKRDRRDRIRWLVERGKWEEALKEVEELERTEALLGDPKKAQGDVNEKTPAGDDDLSVQAIGQKYIHHLLNEHDYDKAASLLPKVCGRGKTKAIAQRWEEWIWEFAGRGHLHAAIPYVPIDAPKLDHVVYEMVLSTLR